MNSLDEYAISCPYCGEHIEVLLDCSVEQQEYIEDCQVCCRPITFKVSVSEDGAASVDVFSENE
jgi:transcription elongation factor Elf1